jgi:hypothetical protein
MGAWCLMKQTPAKNGYIEFRCHFIYNYIVVKGIRNLNKFKNLFWEADVSAIDIDQYKFYIIERILEYGDKPEVNWMFRQYSPETIKEVLFSSRAISNKSSSFWKTILGT